jgi:hypothetical protein
MKFRTRALPSMLSALAAAAACRAPLPTPSPAPPPAAPAEAAAPAPAAVSEAPAAAPPREAGLPGGTGTALDGAPEPPTEPPTGAGEPRPEPVAVDRVLPHLEDGARLAGVERLATGSGGGLEALRVRAEVAGVARAEVLVLDREGALVLRLPRARTAGAGELRVGPLVLSLDDRVSLEQVACGAIDLEAAGAVLRLASLVAEEAIGRVAAGGWGSWAEVRDPDVELLGVAPREDLLPGAVPTAGPSGVPASLELLEVLPATLEGFVPLGDRWRGRVRVLVRDGEGAERVLVVGVAGRLPG